MQSFIKVGLLLFFLHTGSRSFAVIGNNVISGNTSICYGAKSFRLVGTTPSGGTVPFTYQWLSSTAGPLTGYAPAGGTDDGLNYTPLLFLTDTWFRRVAYSGAAFDTSEAFKITVLPSPHPNAGFFANKAVQCFRGNNYIFTDTSTIDSGTIVSRSWFLGDETVATGNSVSKTYPLPFNYNVKLVVTSDQGCKDSMIRTMSVLPQPKAEIACNKPEQCMNGNLFIFADASVITTGSIISIWDFGDGTDTIAAAVEKRYAVPGTYPVKIIAISDYNCRDSATRNITVHPSPRAGFTINSPVQCLPGNHFVFSDTSFITGGLPAVHLWDLGNGDTASIPEISESYSSVNTYTVRLICKSNEGCADTAMHTVTLHAGLSTGFTISNDSQCLAGNSFMLADTSAAPNRIWHLGNGDTSTATAPVVSYTAANRYDISMVSSTAEGCRDSVSQIVVVHPQPATLLISGNTIAFGGQEGVYSVPATSGSAYRWQSEGGKISSVNGTPEIAISWNNAVGRGNIKVIETTGLGCTGDTARLNILINAVPDSLMLGSDTLFVPMAASKDSILIRSNTSWTIAGTAAWISYDQGSGTGNGVLRLSIAANPGAQRIAGITVTAGSVTKYVIINQAGTVGIKEAFGSAGALVYPNPSSGLINITGNDHEPLSVNVSGVNGKQVCAAFELPKGNGLLDYSFLPNGVYNMQIITTTGSRSLKLVIVH